VAPSVESQRQRGCMKALQLAPSGARLSMLCLGAHSDDIEIGAAAMLLSMLERGIRLDAHWCVLNGIGERKTEATPRRLISCQEQRA
jgi:LmbE family N-acetylglucosaminyl deacetylase